MSQGDEPLPADASFMPDVEVPEPDSTTIEVQALPTWGDDTPQLAPRLWPGNDPVPPGTTRPKVPFLAEIQLPPEVDPTVVPEIHLPDYFGGLPETYLVDPQTLLTSDERLALNLALKRSVNERGIPVYILLFQKDQRIPAFETLDGLQKRWFGDKPGAVIGFWLGSPTRTSGHFGTALHQSYGRQVDEAFANALGQSYTKSYPFSQLDHFTYTLLWRFSKFQDAPGEISRRKSPAPDPAAVPQFPEISSTSWVPIAAKGSALAIGVAAIGTGLIATRRRRERIQKEQQHGPLTLPKGIPAERLDAPHCGGSGAIIRASDPAGEIPS